MMKTRVAVALLASAVLATTGFAEPAPEAAEWLDRLETVYDRGPFAFSYSTEVNLLRAGRGESITTEGSVLQADRERFRYRFSMETAMTQGDPTKTRVIGTSDGEIFWLEVHVETEDRHRAYKMPVDRLESAAQRNHPIAWYIASMDPISQILKLPAMFEFEIGSRSEGSVTLVATVPDEVLQRIGNTLPGDPSKLREVTITFDTATEFPTEVRFGEENPVMWIGITDFEYLDDVDVSAFHYEPPEGLGVVDFEEMSKGE